MWQPLAKIKTSLQFRRVSRNQRRYLSSLHNFQERVTHYPVELFLETTNLCNLSCIMCVGRDRIDRSTKELNFDLIKKMKPLIARASTIHPFGYGEPTLYPDFEKLLRLIRSVNPAAIVSFTTNGQLFDDTKIEAVISSGVDTLTFSIDSADSDTYAMIRKGATLDRAAEAIDRVRAAKTDPNSARPGICIEAVLMKHNIASLDDILSFCIDRHIGHLVLERVRFCPELEPEDYSSYGESYRRVAERAAKGRVELVGPFVDEYRNLFYPQEGAAETPEAKPDEKPAETPCYSPWSTMYVRCDGLVLTCCVESPILGDLNKENAKDIWNGAKFRELRRRILSGEFPVECERCISQGRSMLRPTPLPSTD